MRAIYIDAEFKRITEVDARGLQDYYKLIGGGCQLVEVGTVLDNEDTIFVDEEGLLKGLTYAFYYEGAHQPFMGNGVIVGGPDSDGETTEAKSGFIDIASKVIFLSPEQINRFESKLGNHA